MTDRILWNRRTDEPDIDEIVIADATVQRMSTAESDDERDARFAPGNDRTWGAGNWIRCEQCPPDANGRQPYHHREAHR